MTDTTGGTPTTMLAERFHAEGREVRVEEVPVPEPGPGQVRIKVHAAGDVRYIVASSSIDYPELADRVRDKLSLRGRFKIKVKDEDMPDGDMITIGDNDDLDIVVASSKTAARKERQEVGKMEVRPIVI